MNVHATRQRGCRLVPLVAVIAVVAIAAGAGYWFGARQAPARPARCRARRDGAGAVPGGARRRADRAQGAVLARSDGPRPEIRQAGQESLHGHGSRARLRGRRGRTTARSRSARARPELRHAHGGSRREGTLDTGFTAVGAVGVDERGIVAVQARSPGYVEKLHVRAQYDGVAAGQPLVDLYVPDWLAARGGIAGAEGERAARRGAARRRRAAAAAPARRAGRARSRASSATARPSARVTRDGAAVRHRLGDRRARRHGGDARHDAVQARGHRHGVGDRRHSRKRRPRSCASAPRSRRAPPPIRTACSRAPSTRCCPKSNARDADGARAHRARAIPAALLKPGMFATVAFGGARAASRSCWCPAEAVIRTGKRNVVIVDAGEGRFAPVEVDVGRESGDRDRDPQGPRRRGSASSSPGSSSSIRRRASRAR